jgi:hypothetical protein
MKAANSIRRRLIEHLNSSSLATINDCETEALYREAHGLTEDEETDLETVEQWAVTEAAPWDRAG